MDLDVIVLIITGVFAVLAFGFLIAAILISENNVRKYTDSARNINSNTATTEFHCTSRGLQQLAPAPVFERLSSKSSASNPLSQAKLLFNSVDHTVQKLYRTRSLADIVSPNHWLGNAMYGDVNYFCVYPYFGSITDDGLIFAWPGNNILTENCGLSGDTGECPTGNADISYSTIFGPTIQIGSSGNKTLSCDILDVDALVGTVAWQYQNINNGKTGSIIIPLVQGSPFITIKINNINTTLECNFAFTLRQYSDQSIYILQIDESSGYLIFSSNLLSLTRVLSGNSASIQYETIIIPKITDTIRIAYFNSTDMLNILIQHYRTYPIESTISTTSHPMDMNGNNQDFDSWDVDTSFIWTTENMPTSRPSDRELLMLALPHHNLTNTVYESSTMNHSVIGPFRFVITNDNVWNLADAVANYQFTYPPLIGITGATVISEQPNVNINAMCAEMILVWNDESKNIIDATPQNIVEWSKWLGSLANLILIGNMLRQDVTSHLQFLESQLNLIQNKSGAISPYDILVYDKTWGGIVDNLGLTNCMGNSNYGNSFYESHIGQFGYIIYAYAVAGHFNPSFINTNRDMALYFVRDAVNPYQSDNSFPLWRNKNWFLGYSISSGLQPGQINGKNTSNIGETIAGYYGAFLLSLVLPDDSNELLNWSLAMLASEITALQHYFQFSSQPSIIKTINPKFVGGTITDRGDTYYQFTSIEGDYLERNVSTMINMLKPLNLISFDYINSTWATGTHEWTMTGITGNIQSESLAYALAILTVNNPIFKQQAVETIIANRNILLPYGSTWSSVLYWILNQS